MTVGFGTGASREYMIWDSKKMDAPLAKQNLDNGAGVLMPFYDEDSDVLFLAGKGDSGIRYYEICPEEEPSSMIYPISTYRATESTSGCGAVYRRSCNVNINEIIRLYQVVNATQVRPLSFQVPRRSDLFADDLYPPARGDEPSLALEDWLAGENATPKLVNLEGGFQPSEKKEKTIVVKEDKDDSKELKTKYEELLRRVAHLEIEIAKRDAILADLKK